MSKKYCLNYHQIGLPSQTTNVLSGPNQQPSGYFCFEFSSTELELMKFGVDDTKTLKCHYCPPEFTGFCIYIVTVLQNLSYNKIVGEAHGLKVSSDLFVKKKKNTDCFVLLVDCHVV